MKLSSGEEKLGMAIFSSSSSLSIGTLHASFSGTLEYFILDFTMPGLSLATDVSASVAVLERFLPITVLKSNSEIPARNLIPSLLLFLRDPRNFTYRQHYLEVQQRGDTFNQVSMCCPGHIACQSHGDIPRLVQPVTILGKQVPQPTTMKAGTIDVDDVDEHIRTDKVELLRKRVHLSNKIGFLPGNILLHAVVSLKLVAKVLDMVHPRERVTIQKNGKNILSSPDLLTEHYTFCF